MSRPINKMALLDHEKDKTQIIIHKSNLLFTKVPSSRSFPRNPQPIRRRQTNYFTSWGSNTLPGGSSTTCRRNSVRPTPTSR